MCNVQLVFSDSAKYILVTSCVKEMTLYHFIKNTASACTGFCSATLMLLHNLHFFIRFFSRNVNCHKCAFTTN